MTGDIQFIPPLGKNLPKPMGQIQLLPSSASNITVFQKKINFPDINGVQIILISVAADGLDRKLTDLTFAFLVKQNVETRSLELFSKPYLLNYEFIEDPETLGQLFDEKNLNEKKVGINSNYVKRLFAKQLMNHSGGSIERKTNKVYDRSLENYFNSQGSDLNLFTGQIDEPNITPGPTVIGRKKITQFFVPRQGAPALGRIEIVSTGNSDNKIILPELAALMSKSSDDSNSFAFFEGYREWHIALDSYQKTFSHIIINREGKIILIDDDISKKPLYLGLLDEDWDGEDGVIDDFKYILIQSTREDSYHLIMSYSFRNSKGKIFTSTHLLNFHMQKNKGLVDSQQPEIELSHRLMLPNITNDELESRLRFVNGILTFDTYSPYDTQRPYKSRINYKNDILPCVDLRSTVWAQRSEGKVPYLYNYRPGVRKKEEVIFENRNPDLFPISYIELPTFEHSTQNRNKPDDTLTQNDSGIFIHYNSEKSELIQRGMISTQFNFFPTIDGRENSHFGSYNFGVKNVSSDGRNREVRLNFSLWNMDQNLIANTGSDLHTVNSLFLEIHDQNHGKGRFIQNWDIPDSSFETNKITDIFPFHITDRANKTNLYLVVRYLDAQLLPQYLIAVINDIERVLEVSSNENFFLLGADRPLLGSRIVYSAEEMEIFKSLNDSSTNNWRSMGKPPYLFVDSEHNAVYLVEPPLYRDRDIQRKNHFVSLMSGLKEDPDGNGYRSHLTSLVVKEQRSHPWQYTPQDIKDTFFNRPDSSESDDENHTGNYFFAEIMGPIIDKLEEIIGEESKKIPREEFIFIVPKFTEHLSLRLIFDRLISADQDSNSTLILIPDRKDLATQEGIYRHLNQLVALLKSKDLGGKKMLMIVPFTDMVNPNITGSYLRNKRKNPSAALLPNWVSAALDVSQDTLIDENSAGKLLTALEIFEQMRQENPILQNIHLIMVTDRNPNDQPQPLSELISRTIQVHSKGISEHHLSQIFDNILTGLENGKSFQFVVKQGAGLVPADRKKVLTTISQFLISNMNSISSRNSSGSTEDNYKYIAAFIKKFTRIISSLDGVQINYTLVEQIFNEIFEDIRPLSVNNLSEDHPFRLAAVSFDYFHKLLIDNGFLGTKEQAKYVYDVFSRARTARREDGIPGVLILLGLPATGKSTLLKAIRGALKIADPTKNFLYWQGDDLNYKNAEHIEAPLFYLDMSELSSNPQQSEDQMFNRFEDRLREWMKGLKHGGAGVLLLDEIAQPKVRNRLLLLLKNIIDKSVSGDRNNRLPAYRLVIVMTGNTSGREGEDPDDAAQLFRNIYIGKKENDPAIEGLVSAILSRFQYNILFLKPSYSSVSLNYLARFLVDFQESTLTEENKLIILSPDVIFQLGLILGNVSIDNRTLAQALRSSLKELLNLSTDQGSYIVGWKYNLPANGDINLSNIPVATLADYIRSHLTIRSMTPARGNYDRDSVISYVNLSRLQLESIRQKLFHSFVHSMEQMLNENGISDELKGEIMRAIDLYSANHPLISLYDFVIKTSNPATLTKKELSQWSGPLINESFLKQLNLFIRGIEDGKDAYGMEHLSSLELSELTLPSVEVDELGNEIDDGLASEIKKYQNSVSAILNSLIAKERSTGVTDSEGKESDAFKIEDEGINDLLKTYETAFDEISRITFKFIFDSIGNLDEKQKKSGTINISSNLVGLEPYGASVVLSLSIIDDLLVKLPWFAWSGRVISFMNQIINFHPLFTSSSKAVKLLLAPVGSLPSGYPGYLRKKYPNVPIELLSQRMNIYNVHMKEQVGKCKDLLLSTSEKE